jgi:pyrimidine operon attenuation protein / uracil phosphoribosyltransferase
MIERRVMTAEDVQQAIARLAREIALWDDPQDPAVLIGVLRRGSVLARRIAAAMAHDGVEPAVGSLDISLYRDDLTELAAYPIVRPTVLPFAVNGRPVVLIDDVLFTGRTVRAALQAIADHGRPRLVRLAVLVDRGHRELPIRADHVGRNLPTSRQDQVHVRLAEVDAVDAVDLAGTDRAR